MRTPLPEAIGAAGDRSGRPGASHGAIAAAAIVTVLDGFDALSMSLAAPKLASELGVAPSALGLIFASTLGGMIVGAFAGGALAEKVGRVRVLVGALLLFGLAALTMAIVTSAGEIVLNRVVAGIGLGAAAPLAVALLNRSGRVPPSDFTVSLVWAGIAVGGILAALFNYLVIPVFGWRSIFITGGLLPLPAALLVVLVFRADARDPIGATPRRPVLSDLFTAGAAGATFATALMFFLGYVTTSVINNWLPTILTHGKASASLVSLAFAGINIGSAVSTLALGYLSSRARMPYLLAAAWALTGGCVAAAALPSIGLEAVSLFAIGGATLGAGTQALSVAVANRLHRSRGLESATVGLMVSAGRIGQFSALSLSGVLVGHGLPERSLFAFAGLSAVLAAGVALRVASHAPVGSPPDG